MASPPLIYGTISLTTHTQHTHTHTHTHHRLTHKGETCGLLQCFLLHRPTHRGTTCGSFGGLAATGAAADALPAALCASAEAPGATLPVAKDEAAASFEAAEDSRRSFLAACGKGMHAANRPAAMWRSGVLIFETAPTASEVSSDSPCARSSSALSCSDWCSLFICAADGLRITGRPRSGSFV